MDGLCRAIGAAVPVKLGNKTWLLGALTLESLGILENHILSQRKSKTEQLEQFLGALPSDARSGIVEATLEEMRADRSLRVVSEDEMSSYLEEEDGVIFSAWLGFRRFHKGFTHLEMMERFFSKWSEEDLKRYKKARDLASGTDLLASFDWPKIDGIKDSIRAPWRRIMRYLCEERHLDQKTIENWTLYQLRLQLCPEKELGGVARMDAKEALSMIKTDKKIIFIGSDGKGLEELAAATKEWEDTKAKKDSANGN